MNRHEALDKLKPSYRLEQAYQALFNVDLCKWEQISNLPKETRTDLENLPWLTISSYKLVSNKKQSVFKVILKTLDDKKFESVLLANKRDQWTLCLSTQIGCAMKCAFCSTGSMGLTRNLTADEIIDQYRFWHKFLHEHKDLLRRISNLVFMGMGEPLANYNEVKDAINLLLKYTDIGPTKITVSTVGFFPGLRKVIDDHDWPHVRLAISLHSVDHALRKKIMPSTILNFHKNLAGWTHEYASKKGNQSLYLTLEYMILKDINDSAEHAHKLADYFKTTAARKINLISYNPANPKMKATADNRLKQFQQVLCSYDIDVTLRKSLGGEIKGACGQLMTEI